MTFSSKRHGSAVSLRRQLWFTPDWKPWSPVRVLGGWRQWAAASRVCRKFDAAVLGPIWPAADACGYLDLGGAFAPWPARARLASSSRRSSVLSFYYRRIGMWIHKPTL